MAKAKKTTRKFIATKLRGEIQRRKSNQQIYKGKIARIQRRHDRGDQEETQERDNEEEVTHQIVAAAAGRTLGASSARSRKPQKSLEEMDMDEFLNMGDAQHADGSGSDSGGDSDSDAISDDGAFLAEAAAAADDDDDDNNNNNGNASDNVSDSEGTENGTDGKRNGGSEFVRHRRDLARLKETDPEFFEYLRKSDPTLLEFGENELDEEGDRSSEEEPGQHQKHRSSAEDEGPHTQDESAGQGRSQKTRPKKTKSLTPQQFDLLISHLVEKSSIAALKKVLLAFRSAVHMADPEGERSGKGASASSSAAASSSSAAAPGAKRPASSSSFSSSSASVSYAIDSGQMFSAVLSKTLEAMPLVLRNIFQLKQQTASQTAVLPTSVKKARPSQWSRYELFIKSYLGNLLHLLESVTDAEMTAFVLKYTQDVVPFIASVPVFSRKFLKRTLDCMTGGADEIVRFRAFLVVREMILHVHEDSDVALDQILRASFLAVVRRCQTVSYRTLSVVRFLTNCLVELFGCPCALESSTGTTQASTVVYQQVFLLVRQCATHLRNAVTNPSKQIFQTIYNWQFVQSLRCLASIVTSPVLMEGLRPLVYPLVQVILGTIKLVPTVRFYPLRFVLVRCLNAIARSVGSFIPVAPLLLEVIESFCGSALSGSGPGAAAAGSGRNHAKVADLTCTLKVSKQTLKSRVFEQSCMEDSLEILLEFLSIMSRDIAFPELAFVVSHALRRMMKKEMKVVRYKKMVQTLLEKIQENSAAVTERRDVLNVAPKDVERVVGFCSKAVVEEMPLERFFKSERERRDREREAIVKAHQDDVESSDNDDGGSSAGKGDGNGSEISSGDGEEEEDDESDEETAVSPPPIKRSNSRTGPAKGPKLLGAAVRSGKPAEKGGKRKGGDLVKDFSLSDSDE